jgi:hypothetical protein
MFRKRAIFLTFNDDHRGSLLNSLARRVFYNWVNLVFFLGFFILPLAPTIVGTY